MVRVLLVGAEGGQGVDNALLIHPVHLDPVADA
jgi:hypothetical protein